MRKYKFITAVLFLVVATCAVCFAHGKHSNTNADTISKINSYQSQYFKIIKRNNMLLQVYGNDNIDNDWNDLSKLYQKVESQIAPDCEFLHNYQEIKKQFSENTGENTVEMNEFAQNHYNAVDTLLNDTYKAVKLKISQEDFNKLVTSETNWLQDIEEYKTIYNQQRYGTIGEMVYLNYQINMRSFRTLLLMLYF